MPLLGRLIVWLWITAVIIWVAVYVGLGVLPDVSAAVL